MKEVWKECYVSNDYLVSNLGNIYSRLSDKLLNPCVKNNKNNKIKTISLTINNKKKNYTVSRLVCNTFDPEFDNGHIRFKNSNPLDCRFDNLIYNKKILIKNEIWVPCYKLEEKYLISNHGRIKNIKTNRFLKTTINSHGITHLVNLF